MKRLLIYCEGQTEQMVVERLIRPHLLTHGVKVERPIVAATSLDPEGQRGGFVNWEAIQFDLRQEFRSDADPNLRFTTLLDVYAMPQRVLALAGFRNPVSSIADIQAVEGAIAGAFNEPRFKAYLQRHEFEALLLADLNALQRVFPRNKTALQQLGAALASYQNAEDIDGGASTHPAARLALTIPGYENLKASNAYFVLAEAGLSAARAKCPRFDRWLGDWESWGAQT